MSLPYPFLFWVIAEQNRQWGWEVTVSLAILNLMELNLHPRPCPWYSLFLCWKGTLISQLTNQPVCVSVFPHDISKTDAARITKLDIEMFVMSSWKPIYFGVKVKVTSRKNSAGVGLCTLVSAGFFWLLFLSVQCTFSIHIEHLNFLTSVCFWRPVTVSNRQHEWKDGWC